MEDWLEHMTRSMQLQGYAPRSVGSYTSCLMVCMRETGVVPLDLSVGDVEDFLLSLRDRNRTEATLHIYTVALKYFFRLHGRQEELAHLRIRNRRHRLPDVLGHREVMSLLEKCRSLRDRTLFTLLYSAGLRVSELARLEVRDLDFARKQIHVRGGKGNKDRFTLLADKAIPLVQGYLAVHKPTGYLFPRSADPHMPLATCTIQARLRDFSLEQGYVKGLHPHTLRHCFATHLMEQGTNLFAIKELLGHANIQTTLVYLHLRSLQSLGVRSPMDHASGFEPLVPEASGVMGVMVGAGEMRTPGSARALGTELEFQW